MSLLFFNVSKLLQKITLEPPYKQFILMVVESIQVSVMSCLILVFNILSHHLIHPKSLVQQNVNIIMWLKLDLFFSIMRQCHFTFGLLYSKQQPILLISYQLQFWVTNLLLKNFSRNISTTQNCEYLDVCVTSGFVPIRLTNLILVLVLMCSLVTPQNIMLIIASHKLFVSRHVAFVESEFPFHNVSLKTDRVTNTSLSHWSLLDQPTHFPIPHTHTFSSRSPNINLPHITHCPPNDLVHSDSTFLSRTNVGHLHGSSQVSQFPNSPLLYLSPKQLPPHTMVTT